MNTGPLGLGVIGQDRPSVGPYPAEIIDLPPGHEGSFRHALEVLCGLLESIPQAVGSLYVISLFSTSWLAPNMALLTAEHSFFAQDAELHFTCLFLPLLKFLNRTLNATRMGSRFIKALWVVSIVLPVIRFGPRPKVSIVRIYDAWH